KYYLINYLNQLKWAIPKLFHIDMFKPLQDNYAFFKQVKVDETGYAVVWNDEIDISEYELWENGITI
ncbi:MAG: hypothetical protein RLZZ210_491, partial [Pseudomonadota bacterium]